MARQSGTRGKKLDRHYLYSAAVQSVDADIQFFRRVYRERHGRSFRRLREDFCGTALLACDWVRRGPDHEAWAVDLDRATLDWGIERWVPRLGRGAERLHMCCRNVLDVTEPEVDVVAALNFSYSVFKTRRELGGYFAKVRRSLARGGIFILDAWGGVETMGEDREERSIDPETAFDGTKVPRFQYVWEQARFNPIDHRILCHIHFGLRDGTRMPRAFTYDWRLWMLPEIRELLDEAGFRRSDVYVEGWDEDEDEADGIFRKKTRFENQEGWVAYVVGRT
jgi:SAM-dependent methyltransferase